MAIKMRITLIHIWGQKSFHDDAFIVGNRDGIEQLCSALQEALKTGNAVVSAYVNDGEGYDLHIKLDERLQLLGGDCAVPYTADWACEKNKNAIYPWDKK